MRILVVEDDSLLAAGLTSLLARAGHAVDQVRSGSQADGALRATDYELLVLDIGLPDIEGAEVARRVKEIAPACRVLTLSVQDSRFFVQHMLRAGADGYVVKSAALPELVQAIRVVASGRVYLSPDIARKAVAGLAPDESTMLGSRERQVLALLAGGKRSSDIASDLHISVATVEAHRRNIMRKLDLHSVAELTKYAIRQGLTSL